MLSSVYPPGRLSSFSNCRFPSALEAAKRWQRKEGVYCVFLVMMLTMMMLTMMITTTMFSDLERRRKKGVVECVFLVIKYKNCVAENKRTKHISLNIQECVCQPNPDRSNSRPCWRGARRSCPCPHWSSFYLFS